MKERTCGPHLRWPAALRLCCSSTWCTALWPPRWPLPGWRCCFLQLDAQFAGFAQILVYIGAVAILIVFAILLTRGSDLPKDGVFSRTWFVGLVIAAGVFAVLGVGRVAKRARCAAADRRSLPSRVHDIGNALVGRYVLPLEIVALLLTAATIGAVIVAMHEKERPR
jgi:NADH-quinone oxidoreductase subunit J